MKSHGTVIITRKMLRELGACQSGFSAVAELLPATISSDPDKNVAIACSLFSVCGVEALKWVSWLASEIADGGLDIGCGCCVCREQSDFARDDFDIAVMQQALAWVADALLTTQGL